MYKSTGSWYVIKGEDNKIYQGRIKGIFKIDDITSTNPIAVGDIVDIEAENELEQSVMITHIHDRKNYINRKSPSHKMQHHIVAANIDQCLLVATLKEPRTSQGFLDRFLVACEAFHVPAILFFNKSDIYKEKEKNKFRELKEMYEAVGYHVVLMSIKNGEGIDEVREILQNKVSLISGHSGVGKSSFINTLLPVLLFSCFDL